MLRSAANKLTATKACAVLAPASLAITLVISCVGPGSGIEPPKSNSYPPNLIYILADDLGYGDLGRYGQRLISTPNLDRLAAEGMVFTQHYAGSTVCAPSRDSRK